MSDNVKPITMSAEMLDAIRGMLARNPEHVSKNSKLLLAEVDALRARVAELEAALADERKLADELAHSLMKEAAQTGEGCFFASTEVVIADHNARRAKEAAGE